MYATFSSLPARPYDRAPHQQRDLADHCADRTRSRRNDHDVTRLGLSNVEKSKVGGQAGHTKYP